MTKVLVVWSHSAHRCCILGSYIKDFLADGRERVKFKADKADGGLMVCRCLHRIHTRKLVQSIIIITIFIERTNLSELESEALV